MFNHEIIKPESIAIGREVTSKGAQGLVLIISYNDKDITVALNPVDAIAIVQGVSKSLLDMIEEDDAY